MAIRNVSSVKIYFAVLTPSGAKAPPPPVPREAMNRRAKLPPRLRGGLGRGQGERNYFTWRFASSILQMASRRNDCSRTFQRLAEEAD